MIPELVKLNQVIYLQGLSDGFKTGFEKGFLLGVEATLDQLGKEASEKLRSGNGNPMAFYREIKQKYPFN